MLIASTSVATAQEAAPPAAAPAPEAVAAPESVAIAPAGTADGCELHVWPAERMNSITTGLLGGGLLDAALHANRDASNKTMLASALDSQSQLDALLSLDLRGMLKLSPGTTIITHAMPLERKTMNSVKTRRSSSQAKCYSELIVADVFYQKAAIYGRSLKTLFMVRDFGSDSKIDFEYKAWGGNGLKLFPPKEGEDALAALDELVGVFKKNFDEYAGNEAKAPRKPEKI
ncbi:hypothetical protein [Novosphingobium cyanobacteriorum]|uniref:Uncharacterized protein n=1 Tax=Novosphingobium cyanobacteriorum TaxID=3024215 RepID=A0ABT6CL23_9SPHN|nr:hypothetical protein [Novosphingobium cyanobacteriorum]MDF8334542.1 hypothetical protein [Novosphingobium cyanobacteriorum]